MDLAGGRTVEHANCAELACNARVKAITRSGAPRSVPRRARRSPARRATAHCVFKAKAGGGAMESDAKTRAVGTMRRVGTIVTRLAVALLLGSAVTVAVVAAGLDLLPLLP